MLNLNDKTFFENIYIVFSFSLIFMFRFLEHESEIGVEACSSSFEGLFVESSKALFSIMTDISRVRCENSFFVKVDSFSVEELLVELLNELVFLFNVNFSFFSKFEYKIFEKVVDGRKKFFLEGRVCGETISEDKHVFHVEVKAVTFSGLKFFVRKKSEKSRKSKGFEDNDFEEFCAVFIVDI